MRRVCMLDFLKLQQEFCEMNEAEIFYKSSFYNLFFDVDDAIILFNVFSGEEKNSPTLVGDFNKDPARKTERLFGD
jgi:hypothetical protein